MTTPAPSASSVRGGCRCGKVAFDFDPPSRFCAHCHCESCRRSHGAAFVTWVGTLKERFRLHDPEGMLRRYTSARGATRSFCGNCGAMMLFESPEWPGEVHVARAQIPGAIDREPQVHVFYGEHVPWVTVGDDLKKLEAM